MEAQVNKVVIKKKAKGDGSSSIKISKEVKKKLNSLLIKINKKDFGKRVRADKVILLALQQIEEKHIKELQSSTLTNADKLEIKYREYVSQNGSISKDDFIGKLLSGEGVSTF